MTLAQIAQSEFAKRLLGLDRAEARRELIERMTNDCLARLDRTSIAWMLWHAVRGERVLRIGEALSAVDEVLAALEKVQSGDTGNERKTA